jgi:hypothetical protein
MSFRESVFYRYSAEIFLFLATFFIRFPFFFRDYIDQDESTFILMGQSIADGHLPYDHLWDLKPPLLFYIFALIEKMFPLSFVAIRFVGVLVIFLSALLLIRIAKQARLKNGFLIALGYVLLSSEFGSLQGVMSEHFAVLFLLLGLSFLIGKQSSYFLIAGLSFGCAVLCKLNYAYAITALLIFYFAAELKKRKARNTAAIFFVLAGGIIIPILLTAMPFIAEGKINLFINSVFLAPLEYARALNYSSIDKFKTTWWILLLIVAVCYFSIRASTIENKSFVLKLMFILLGTGYTFYSTGIINGHYLVQIYPFFLMLLFGVIIQKEVRLKPGFAAVIVFLLSFESVLEYYRLVSNLKDFAEYRPTFEVVRELKRLNLQNNKIFFADYHVGYWLINQYPLTKSTTHPSNISRPYLFKYYNDSSKSSLEDLNIIMLEIQPNVIVSKYNKLQFFADTSPENLFFKENLSQNFEKIYEDSTDQIFIWKRKK